MFSALLLKPSAPCSELGARPGWRPGPVPEFRYPGTGRWEATEPHVGVGGSPRPTAGTRGHCDGRQCIVLPEHPLIRKTHSFHCWWAPRGCACLSWEASCHFQRMLPDLAMLPQTLSSKPRLSDDQTVKPLEGLMCSVLSLYPRYDICREEEAKQQLH